MEFNAQITKLIMKYYGNTYASVEIIIIKCTDFMCDLEVFSKIRSHIVLGELLWVLIVSYCNYFTCVQVIDFLMLMIESDANAITQV